MIPEAPTRSAANQQRRLIPGEDFQFPTRITSKKTPSHVEEDTIREVARKVGATPELVRRLFKTPTYKAFPGTLTLNYLLGAGAIIMEPHYQQSTSTVKKVLVRFPRTRCYYPEGTFGKAFPFITFSINGVPGISLRQAVGVSSSRIDDADDVVYEGKVRQHIGLQLDWSGLLLPPFQLRTTNAISRGKLAIEVGQLLLWLNTEWYTKIFPVDHTYNVHAFSPKNIDLDTIRIFGVEFVGNLWIPVFGVGVKLET